MAQVKNEFGKRPADDDEAALPSKRRSAAGDNGRTGLHRFARPSPPAPDMAAVQERFGKFVQSALALKGATDFRDLMGGQSAPGAYAKEHERCAAVFHQALPAVLADTPSLDADQQRLLVEMACNTEKAADAGKAIALTFEHIGKFGMGGRSSLLLNGICAFPYVPAETRSMLCVHLGDAVAGGYLEPAHRDAVSEAQRGQPPEIAGPLSAFARRPERSLSPKLGELPPEILQNILLRAVEPDLRKERLAGLEGAIKTIDAIMATDDSRLQANADELQLPAFSADSKKALSVAGERYGTFLLDTHKFIKLSRDENIADDDPRLQRAFGLALEASMDLVASTKLLGESEQSMMVSRFCKIGGVNDVSFLLAQACERADDLFPKARSEMFSGIIQMLPTILQAETLSERVLDKLAKAHLARQLEPVHYNALVIAELNGLNVGENLAERVDRFSGAAASSLEESEMADLEGTPLSEPNSIDQPIADVVDTRQRLLEKLDRRPAGDRGRDRDAFSI